MIQNKADGHKVFRESVEAMEFGFGLTFWILELARQNDPMERKYELQRLKPVLIDSMKLRIFKHRRKSSDFA
ncbi:hypothetical protein N9O24_00555 [bacterium]|nr:hypothetical protein [bacterium]